jgi:putative thiamine transport system ATP-binding protein
MALKLDQVSIALDGQPLIKPFSLAIAAGEIATLMGPSGSGKSSLLAYIAGDLAAPLEGNGAVSLDGREINSLRPEARRIGRLFQDDLLFPHMTVGENLLFGMARGDRTARLTRMRDALAAAELQGFEDRQPHTLSAGQRSRVALFRALLAEPLVMLLDEPFARLDQDLRDSMRSYVYSHLEERRIPALLVTHDLSDAPPDGKILKILKTCEVVNA